MRETISRCILFHFYIKPQLPYRFIFICESCILFHFYIKPQRIAANDIKNPVVSYSISTSNHNHTCEFPRMGRVVSYSISTSNHNKHCSVTPFVLVVSYSISTSNHNPFPLPFYKRLVVSYSISTSNHNYMMRTLRIIWLYLIPFLHQTTTEIVFIRSCLSLYLIPFLHQTTTYGA